MALSNNQIKEKIAPHFGNLETFEKWASQSSIKNVLEIIDWIKSHKSISKIQLKDYDYYSFLLFMVECERNHKLEMTFKTEFSGDRKKWFYETFEELKKEYMIISENEQKFLSLKKNASKPKSLDEFKQHVICVSKFSEYTDLLESDKHYKFGENEQYILIELNEENCGRLCPPVWCITNIPTFRDYTRNQKIYLLIDQFREDSERFIGINYVENSDYIASYQNSLNAITTVESELEKQILEILKANTPKKKKKKSKSIKNMLYGAIGLNQVLDEANVVLDNHFQFR